jgi:hypothetical protein
MDYRGNRVLGQIYEEIELEGYTPGSPEFERLFRARRVEKCQEMQGVRDCETCKAFIDCDLIKQHRMDKKFGGLK